MGVQTLPVPVTVLPTRRTVVFTSSTTWTVPSSCIYADVMVVGGGMGGSGGYRATDMGYRGGTGGAITIAQNLYLGGTGTIAITVGAGTSGTAGVATTTPTNASAAGSSFFGTLVASQGGESHGNGSSPAYRGSVSGPYNGNDTNLNNYTPILQQIVFNQPSPVTPINGSSSYAATNTSFPSFGYSTDAQFWGIAGGFTGAGGSAGGIPGNIFHNSNNRVGTTSLNRIPWGAHLLLTFGAATGGTAGSGGGGGGAAGLSGYAGGGGSGGFNAGAGGAGGPGAGGGGGNPSAGGTGGNGGNAGTNTGAGGGGGGGSNSTTAGTGGNGGNGAAGFIIVSYIGTN